MATSFTYYNDSDPKKCEWVRELIKRGLVTDGEVDERSIQLIHPDDLRGFRRCHFFCGIAIWDYALNLARWGDRQVWTGSCPCQPFSAAGKGAAFDDERHLWPEFFRLIKARRPDVVFGEQVSSIDGLAWFDVVRGDLDNSDYTYGVLDTFAGGVGAPHRRKRLYWCASNDRMADASIVGQLGRRTGETRGWSGEPEQLRDAGGLADNTEARRTGARQHDGGLPPLPARSQQHGTDGRMEDADSVQPEQSAGKWAGASGQGSGRSCGELAGPGTADSVEDTMRPERGPDQRQQDRHRQAPQRDESTDRAGERSEVERMENAEHAGSPLAGTKIGCGTAPNLPAGRSRTGQVNGFWRSADWVLTRPQRLGDRPGIRPIESIAQPLVNGAPPGVGRSGHRGFPLAKGEEARVMRLHGYGDGIVATQAAAFVKAYCQAKGLTE